MGFMVGFIRTHHMVVVHPRTPLYLACSDRRPDTKLWLHPWTHHSFNASTGQLCSEIGDMRFKPCIITDVYYNIHKHAKSTLTTANRLCVTYGH